MDTKLLLLLREKSANKPVDTTDQDATEEKTATRERGENKPSAVAVAAVAVWWWCAWTLECTTTSWLVHSGVQPGPEVLV